MTSETGVTALTSTSVGINGGLEAANRALPRSFKTTLALSGVGIALIASLASPARAECTVNMANDTVTCDDEAPNPDTAANAENLFFGLDAGNRTLVIEEDAELVTPFSGLFLQADDGNVTVTNAGEAGTDAATVSFVGFGDGATSDDDAFSVTNSGFAGGVFVGAGSTFDGGVTVTNTGVLDGEIELFSGTSETDGDFDSETDGDITTETTTSTTTSNGAPVSVTVAAGASSGNIDIANAAGANTISVDGTVDEDGGLAGIDVNATRFGNNTTSTTVDVINGETGAITRTVTDTSSVPTSSTTVTTGAMSTVSGDINLVGQGTTTSATIGGLVGTVDTSMTMNAGDLLEAFSLNINTVGTNTSTTTVQSDPDGVSGFGAATVTSSTTTDASGAIDVAITEGARITGQVTAEGGDAGATLTGTGGAIDGSVFVRTTAFGTSNVAADGSTDTVGGDIAIELTEFAVGGSGEVGAGTFDAISGGGAIGLTATDSTFGFDDDGEGNFIDVSLDSTGSSSASTSTTTTAMGVTTIESSTDNTDDGGDITVALDGTTLIGDLSASSGAGLITLDLVDSTIAGVEGESTASVSLTSNGEETDTESVTTSSGATTVSMDMLTSTTTSAGTTDSTTTTTNVGGAIAATLTDSVLLGDFAATSGAGGITLDVSGSTIEDVDGEDGIDLDSTATDTTTVVDNEFDNSSTTVTTMNAMAMSTTVTTTVDNESSDSTVVTNTATGGDIAATFTDAEVISDLTANSGSGAITLDVVDSAFGDDENGSRISLTSAGQDSTSDTAETSMTDSVTTMVTAPDDMMVLVTTTTTTSTEATTFDQTVTSTNVGGDIAATFTGSTITGDLDVSTGSGNADVTVSDSTFAAGEDSDGSISITAIATDFNSVESDATTIVNGVTVLDQDNFTQTQTVAGGSVNLTITDDSVVEGDVSITSDAPIDFVNNARLKGDVFLDSQRNLQTLLVSDNLITRTPSATNVVVQTDRTNTTVTETVGNDISFLNTGIIGDPVINSAGSVTFENTSTGVILFDTSIEAAGTTTESTTVFSSTETIPNPLPAMSMTAPSDRTFVSSSVTNSSSTATGGTIDFVNAGSLGALGIDDQPVGGNFNGAVQFPTTAVNVNLFANAGVTLANSGVIVGSVTAQSFGIDRTTTDTVDVDLVQADFNDPMGPGATTVTTDTSTVEEFDVVESDVVGTFTGLVSNEGPANGNVLLNAFGGDATAMVTGGVIEGSLTTQAGNASTSRFNNNSTFESTGSTTTVNGVELSGTFSSETTVTAQVGNSTVMLVGGRVGESTAPAFINSFATGDVLTSIDATSIVFGDVFGTSNGSTVMSSFEETRAFTPGGAATRTTTSSTTNTPTGGDVTTVVAGRVTNTTNLNAAAGNADLTLTGRSDNGFSVRAGALATDSTVTTSQVGPAPGTYATTDTLVANDGTWLGGTATALVNSNASLQSTNTPAVTNGNITVVGFGGSSLTIAAGSQVFTTNNSNSIQVGGVFSNTTSLVDTDFTGVGTQEADTTSTTVGGDATILIDGNIGTPMQSVFAYYDNNNNSIGLTTIGTGLLTNNGLTHADVFFDGLFSDTVTNSVGTNVNDPLFGDVTTTTTTTAVGGDITIVNNAVIGGNISGEALTATVENNGSVRGGIFVGGSTSNRTVVTEDTALTSSTITGVTPGDAYTQTYTINQNGLVGGAAPFAGFGSGTGIRVNSAGSATDAGTVDATVNLNDGSVTVGAISAAFSQTTGARSTMTDVNLNGGGFVGLSGRSASRLAEAAAALAPYGPIDPLVGTNLPLAGNLVAALAAAPSSIRGVDTITKTGDGTFVIFGAAANRITGTVGAPNSTFYTLDTGLFTINDGLVELDVDEFGTSVASNQFFNAALSPTEGTFGIRGDLVNNAGLTIGRTIPVPQELFLDNLVGQGSSVIDGIQVFQSGDFTQTDTGFINVGLAPDLVRSTNVTVTGGGAPGLFGFSPAGVQRGFFTTLTNFQNGLTGSGQEIGLLDTSLWVVDGDLDLGGTVNLNTITNALFVGGSTTDLFRVTGDTSVTATVNDSLNSRFVSFGLGTRVEGTETVVFLQTNRVSFTTAAPDPNAAAAAAGLDRALPSVVSRIQSDAAGGNAFFSVEEFAFAQDLATVIAALDTQLTDAQIAQAFVELSSAEVYGSLAAVRTTDPFGTWTRSAPARQGTGSFFLWGNINANFEEYDFNEDFGAAGLDADQYGGSAGLGFATESDILFGIGAGYSQIDATDDVTGDESDGDTYTIGAWVNGPIGPVNFGLQAVFGWTNWNTVRNLPLFSRTATAEFDSNEFRANARVGYDYALSDIFTATPYVAAEIRTYDFEGFTEEGAGGIGLVVEQLDDSQFSPEIGVDFTGELETGLATLLPRLTLSYVFQGDLETARDVTYLGDSNGTFTLVGVDPENYFQISGGLEAKIGDRSSAFLQASYATGDDRNAASVGGGVRIGF